MTRTAAVTTPNAQRYMTQLSKHWAHKFEVTLDGPTSRIALPLGTVSLNAGETVLALILDAPAASDLDQLAEVVERHIDRFAYREGSLVYDWSDTQAAD